MQIRAAAAPLTIAVVDPNPEAEALAQALTREGFSAWHVTTAADAERLTRAEYSPPPALVLLELILPDADGLSVCEHLVAAGLPVVVRSATRRRLDSTRALQIGAQDFVPKDVGYDELCTRIRRLLASRAATAAHAAPRARPFSSRQAGNASDSPRHPAGRTTGPAAGPFSTVSFSDLRHQVSCSGRTARLSSSDYSLLQLLAECGERPVTRQAIAAHLWPEADPRDPKLTDAVPSCIYHLRVRLRCTGLPLSIRTLRGFGYTLYERSA